jgi:two-component sensor histidine kinase
MIRLRVVINKSLILLVFFLSFISYAQKTKDIDSLYTLVSQTKSDSIKSFLFKKISRKYAPLSFDSAYYYGKKALNFAYKSKSSNQVIDAYSVIGLAFDYQSEIDSTLFWYNGALKFAKQKNNTKQLIKIYNHIGVAYFFDTKYDLSLENYLHSLDYSKQINDSVGIARCYNNIGLIHEKQKNYEEAIRFNLQSLAIKENFKSKASLIHPLTNLSNIYIIKNDFINGKKYMLRMLRITQELKDTTLMAVAYSNLAKIHAINHQLKKSGVYLQKTLDIMGRVSDKFEYSQLLFDLGGTFEKTGDFNKAEKSYLEAISISEKLRKRELLEKAYKELSNLYRKGNQLQKALSYYDKYTKVKDSFFTLDKHRSVSEIEAKYKTQRKEQQIQILKSNIKQQKRFWFWVSTLLILIAILLVFFFLSNKRRSDELALKNKEINKALFQKETLLKEIHHRVKNNLQVISSILSLQIRYLINPKAIAAIKDSQNRIDAISLIHQKLYSKESITAIRIKDYINDLVDNIVNTLEIEPDKVLYTSKIVDLLLEVDTVTSIGLILNELILNSLKHNFNKDSLNLRITLSKQDKLLILTVKDDGKGILSDFDFQKTDSYGMKMITSVAKKLKATIDFINKDGLLVTLTINKFKEFEN